MHSPKELIEDIRQGKMVVLLDDESRENEGDLVIAADYVTPQTINFMCKEARGLICLTLTSKQIDRLGIPLMVSDTSNYSPNKTAFTISIEASDGISTGISAADRAHTIKVASSPSAKPSDVIMPGHIFPIKAQEGGVLKRAGHTEGSVDLARLAGLTPAAVICEVMNEDGSMARTPDLIRFAEKHGLKIGTIEDLIQYRIESETFVREVASSPFSTTLGSQFTVKVFRNDLDGREHLVFIKGDISQSEDVLVRVHAEHILGDIFGDVRYQSGLALQNIFKQIDDAGAGVIVYLRVEDMNQRLIDRVSRNSTAEIAKPVFTDKKEYGVGAQILRALGLKKIRLITNRSIKRIGLKGYGIEVIGTQPFTQGSMSRPKKDRNTNKERESRA
ncbi:MAG: 3,4-dihydroxy-2-butanone-4-phosphate synthase [Bdellovibrionales bacterium]|nr:3,4-dihydroxy-2-butanone-4-phosphate synthase [Bdellovibrionales bacterium]